AAMFIYLIPFRRFPQFAVSVIRTTVKSVSAVPDPALTGVFSTVPVKGALVGLCFVMGFGRHARALFQRPGRGDF
ncbi:MULTISPECIES: hypothetical protein, partial [unclassified Arthrobacter]|uniref:hypothetical protein n=1 Tax=unclassified Arthrobacter TaxID=235627 RepID=UPI001E2D5074